MTREEEVRHAAYAEYCNSESICFTLLCNSFKQGAEWADNHPKSPWISVDNDLPCNHQDLTHSNYTDRVLISARNGFVEVAFMSKIENVWVWETPIKVSHWMPIPKLPKE